jgi:hypothetical protein
MRPDEIHELLPAYCAGTLPDDLRDMVAEAILRSPVLLAEAMELTTVSLRLDEVRDELARRGRMPANGTASPT